MKTKTSNFINKQEDHRSQNRAYRDLTVFQALHSQRSAYYNAVLDDSFNSRIALSTAVFSTVT